MEMKRINRSPVVAIGYDEKNRRMVVELTTGTWEYANVSPELYRRFASAAVPGSFYRDNIEEDMTGRRLK
jgi:hypothetical protein